MTNDKNKKLFRVTFLAILLLLGIVATSSSASAYYFTKGSSTDLQVHFSSSSDVNIAKYYSTAYSVASAGKTWAKSHGINLGSRTTSDMANEIRFHAIVYYYVPNTPFYENGRWRWSKDAANPADVGRDNNYWGDYGSTVNTLARQFM